MTKWGVQSQLLSVSLRSLFFMPLELILSWDMWDMYCINHTLLADIEDLKNVRINNKRAAFDWNWIAFVMYFDTTRLTVNQLNG